MKINAQAIIDETISVFEKSGAADIYRSCKDLVGDEDYKCLHPSALTPLDIKIDAELFNKEMATSKQSLFIVFYILLLIN